MPDSLKRILVVDDDETVRELCRIVLGTAGYSVETACMGRDGLDKLAGTEYDLVISDFNMPELNGMEFYFNAVEGRPEMRDRFMFITGSLTVELKKTLSRNNLSCLLKPFRISELLGSVECVMKKSISAGAGGERREGRLRFDGQCSISNRGSVLSAKVLDISSGGFRAEYRGRLLESGAEITVSIVLNGLALERAAKVAWSSTGGRKAVSGVLFHERLPVSSIINMPAREM